MKVLANVYKSSKKVGSWVLKLYVKGVYLNTSSPDFCRKSHLTWQQYHMFLNKLSFEWSSPNLSNLLISFEEMSPAKSSNFTSSLDLQKKLAALSPTLLSPHHALRLKTCTTSGWLLPCPMSYFVTYSYMVQLNRLDCCRCLLEIQVFLWLCWWIFALVYIRVLLSDWKDLWTRLLFLSSLKKSR